MTRTAGFSLTEVLVALFLTATASLALLKQQWCSAKLFNQMHFRMLRVMELNNFSETISSELPECTQPNITCSTQKKGFANHLLISWLSPDDEWVINRAFSFPLEMT